MYHNTGHTIRCSVSRTLHTLAAVGTAWPLLGSPRNGQAELYLFQKHLLCWQYVHSASHCGKFHPRTGHESPEREQIHSSTLPSTSALGAGGWSTRHSDRFTHGIDPVPIVQEAGWAPGLVWTALPLPRFDPRTVQPVAIRCTKGAIPVHSVTVGCFEKPIESLEVPAERPVNSLHLQPRRHQPATSPITATFLLTLNVVSAK